MPVDGLGGRMHRDVGAEFQRPRQQRGRRRAVHGEQRACRMGEFRGSGDVDDPQPGIRGSLHPDDVGRLAKRLAERAGVRRVDEVEPDAAPGAESGDPGRHPVVDPRLQNDAAPCASPRNRAATAAIPDGKSRLWAAPSSCRSVSSRLPHGLAVVAPVGVTLRNQPVVLAAKVGRRQPNGRNHASGDAVGRAGRMRGDRRGLRSESAMLPPRRAASRADAPQPIPFDESAQSKNHRHRHGRCR